MLREHALIESVVSSNRIEGVQVDQSRVRAIILGRTHLRDRNEEEVRGYRNALKLNYVLFILKSACREFEERVGQIKSPRGAKTELITSAVEQTRDPFRVSDIQRECPGVSVDMIRRVLKSLRAAGQVKCLGRGQNVQWKRLMPVK